jgi:crotonobetainyl-CoA:carnitine CoA-transferase CaiB-like acyl-CoA transferase
MQDEQLVHRRFLSKLGTPAEPFLVANVPYTFSRSIVRAQPFVGKLGEHNAEIIDELKRQEDAEQT